MNKLLYKNDNVKLKMDKMIEEEYSLILRNVILKLMSKYKVYEVIINDVNLGYDSINLEICNRKDNEEIYEFIIDISTNIRKVLIRRKNSNIYDIYKIVKDRGFITEKVYEISSNNKISKSYTTDGKEGLIYKKGNLKCIGYRYNLINNNLNSTISIIIPQDVIFNESRFINELLNSDFKLVNLNELCKKIISLFDTNDLYIDITNETKDNYEEKIIIWNSTVLGYKKVLKSGLGLEEIKKLVRM